MCKNSIPNNSKTYLNNIINKPYKYGFHTDIDSEYFPRGLSIKIIQLISSNKKEPSYLTEFRLKAYSKWIKMNEPKWSKLLYKKIDYNNIIYYCVPKNKKKINSLKEVDPEILKTFEKLGISLDEQKRLTNVAVDAVFDSVSITTTFKKELADVGVIFCSISEAIQLYPNLIKKYLGSVVPIGDNFYSALNSAAFSDGSFCYIPPNTHCPLELSTYFRINNKESGQFERTLIIADQNSYVSYLEGCTAPQFDNNQLHAAIVELVALDNATIKYSTVQNWYSGNSQGNGGIYNFVTKRGMCIGENSKILWTQVETGSAITWKYPSCILLGKNSLGEFSSIALTNYYQQADTGSKMIHIGQYTKSKITSKGISAGCSVNSYRGLVKIGPKAKYAKNYSQCDSLLLGNRAHANTFPYIQVKSPYCKVEHEASTSKIGEEQLFYFLQRGINLEQAIGLMINGFCKEILNNLPMEFAMEADRLLNLKLEGTIG
uniref:Iron-sulfur cluster assembly SufBD family protein ycf24 n=1 Tax=Ophidocladus simpliciusculus TaxID=1261574 RepID=A0A1Z1MJG0_9FLOR|nr:Iron-sulfur cluster assembly protein SufB [Ophidocladus simpliciusculus]ARW65982.1 Iron-sulfur cluster assembly protein SufB [Ophidocladus simpliciusculus]